MKTLLHGELCRPVKEFYKLYDGYHVTMVIMVIIIRGNLLMRRIGLMVSALDSRSSGPGSNLRRGHCVVLWGYTLDSRSAFEMHCIEVSKLYPRTQLKSAAWDRT